MKDELDLLIEARDIIEKRYKAACYEADWFNNNTPYVGQTIDYMSRPEEPKELKLIKQAIRLLTELDKEYTAHP